MIQIDMKMPKDCRECKFFLGCPTPDDFPFCKCYFLGNVGSMFNLTGSRPIDCPLKEVK